MCRILRRAFAGLVLLLLAALPLGLVLLRPDWGYRAVGRMRTWVAVSPLEAYVPTEVEWVVPEEAGTLMLVNAEHPLPEGFVPVVTFDASGAGMHPALAEAYAALREAVLVETGEGLLIRDSYRSRAEQEALYAADPVLAALPGTGEHEAALALDICVKGYGGMAFLKTAAGRWVGDNAQRFGLIIRYPDGGEGETGIPYEPWHVRYVGLPHAEVMAAGRMTLEGYLASLEAGVFYRYGEWCISRQPPGEAYAVPVGAADVTAAPDNCGYAVVSCRIGAKEVRVG